MNKEYLYNDGKCIVYDEGGIIKDENGNIVVREYTDKLDEILVQENLVESMEDELNKVDQEITKRKRMIKSNKNSVITNSIIATLMPVFLQQIFKFIIGEELLSMVLQEVFLSNVIKGVMLAGIGIFVLGFILPDIKNYKYNKRKLHGFETKKEEAEKLLEKEKEKLEELHKTKEVVQPKEKIYSKKVEYLNELIKQRVYLDLYYGCGYNRKKYEKYLQAGKLERKLLRKGYTEEEIKLIRENIESNIQQEEPVILKLSK